MGQVRSPHQIGEGHVFHGRGDGIEHRFKYPTFFLFFRCADEASLRASLRARGKFFLSLKPEDYLEGKGGALDSLARSFLRDRCGYEAEEVWLHTLPRMFGYAFNPVSFWICRRGGEVDAVLCEVNNTFGERHFYWLRAENGSLGADWVEARKVFHVSPFMPVDGYYRFRFRIGAEVATIDINYHGADGKLRLATWISGVLRPLVASGGKELLLRYGWLTPLVVVRIHSRALLLFFRKAKFYSKPNPPSKEVTCSNDP